MDQPTSQPSSQPARLSVLDHIESGDSSVVISCTFDQVVVDSNPTHGANLISVVRLLSGFTQPIQKNEYHIELDLKLWSMSFADWL